MVVKTKDEYKATSYLPIIDPYMNISIPIFIYDGGDLEISIHASPWTSYLNFLLKGTEVDKQPLLYKFQYTLYTILEKILSEINY